MNYSNERRHSRIQYPVAARPQISIGSRTFEVLDVSEGGVRFKTDDSLLLKQGDAVAGTIRFRRNETVEVKGSVVRIGGREVALQLDVGVPLKIIIEEQRLLRGHHRGTA